MANAHNMQMILTFSNNMSVKLSLILIQEFELISFAKCYSVQ